MAAEFPSSHRHAASRIRLASGDCRDRRRSFLRLDSTAARELGMGQVANTANLETLSAIELDVLERQIAGKCMGKVQWSAVV